MVYDSLDAKLHIILDNAKISRRFLVFILKAEKHMIAIWRTSSAKLQ